MTCPDSFVFLGQHGGLRELGWDGSQREKLWRYNQHYFDDLNARDSPLRADWHRTLLNDWVQQNPLGCTIGWDPYPTSLRIVNWVKWVLAGNTLSTHCLDSLALQTRSLTKTVETHLLGNHLFANAKALVCAGLFFNGVEAGAWLNTGLHILRREVPEQILPDGGHFERSTMYHALAIEDMLDICNLVNCFCDALTDAQREQVAEWRSKVVPMLNWLQALCHPDGDIAFFNDAAFGVGPTPSEIIAYAARLGFCVRLEDRQKSCWLQDSGYARLATQQAVALLDLAAIGPDYLPAHAHADTLSFEMSINGQRVLVNSGTSCYGNSDERLRQRGTAAHNTVVVESEDSSEVWGAFRVARRARILTADVQTSSHGSKATGSHNGYIRFPGKPIHHRRWALYDYCFDIEDTISNAVLTAVARFHLHPDVKVVMTDSNRGVFLLNDGQVVTWAVLEGDGWVEASTWHPRFGESIANKCLCIKLKGGKCFFRINWN